MASSPGSLGEKGLEDIQDALTGAPLFPLPPCTASQATPPSLPLPWCCGGDNYSAGGASRVLAESPAICFLVLQRLVRSCGICGWLQGGVWGGSWRLPLHCRGQPSYGGGPGEGAGGEGDPIGLLGTLLGG